MSRCIEIKQLLKNGHCICCGKDVIAKQEEVIRIDPFMSKPQKLTICFDCIDYMNNLKNAK